MICCLTRGGAFGLSRSRGSFYIAVPAWLGSSLALSCAMKNLDGQLQRWEKTRRMGRNRFIWRFGVLYWGVFTGIVCSLAMWCVTGRSDSLFLYLIPALVLFPIGGYFWGWYVWQKSEKIYTDKRRQTDA